MFNNISSINFFSIATGKYEQFVVPYAFSIYFHNINSSLEILVNNKRDFRNKYKKGINFLKRNFPKNKLLIREIPKDLQFIASLNPNTVRFLAKPKLKKDYTYIGDIDILILEQNIIRYHKRLMKIKNIPISNVKRFNENRLSGLQCVKTSDYYKSIDNDYIRDKITFIESVYRGEINDIKDIAKSDERLLYKIYEDNFNNNVYNNNEIVRPTHGFHISLNREPLNLDSFNWGLSHERHFYNYIDFYSNVVFVDFLEIVNNDYKDIIKTINQNLIKHYGIKKVSELLYLFGSDIKRFLV